MALLVSAPACASRTSGPPPKVAAREVPKAEPLAVPWRGASDAGGWERTPPAGRTLIRGGRILVGDGREIASGHVLIDRGLIAAVGEGAGDATGATVVEASGKFVTPGLIDTHSHLGVYPMPRANAHSDGNEMTAPVTSEVRAVDGFWPFDPGIQRAVAGGTTTIQVLPGSANLIGGRAVTLKLRPATSSRAMHFAGAPDGLKMACGENPKRVYGGKGRAPATRMGNLAGQRAAFHDARRLIDEWDRWLDEETQRRSDFRKALAETAAKREERRRREAWCETARGASRKRQCEGWARDWAKEKLEDPKIADGKPPPKRNLQLEALAAAIEGRVIVHVHCYRSDDMVNMLALADEIGFPIRSFHHALEAYKIKDELARRKIGISTWADWWGFKLEAYDGIEQNLALAEAAGGVPIVHSDSAEGIQRLNQEAAKGLYAGLYAGVKLEEARWIRWVTLNPAWALGVDHRVGSLEKGKDADVVIWSANPLSVYAKAEHVYVDGVLVLDAANPGKPWSDFEVAP